MIKGMQQLIVRMKAEFSVAIRSHVYAELQDFVQLTLADPLSKAQKQKKDLISGFVNRI
jgi:cytoplasmic FMR1 interacting protein